jgi:hypothetical protein
MRLDPSSFQASSGDSLAASRQEFGRARYQAAVEDILAQLRGQPADLLPFEEVRQKLHLASRSYRGLHEVPLDKIVGSVGRYRDFTRSFLPRRSRLRQRWSRVDRLAAEQGVPPIELYKVGDCYFVLDGNHRVSVAHQAQSPAIEAHVWEYQTRIPLLPDTVVDDLLIKKEYLEFLEHTRLDHSYPDQRIEFTVPGGYRELEYQVAFYQDALGKIDGRPFGYEEAAAYWYDMIYTAVVQIIEQRGVLKDFPGRTQADLFVWVVRHQRELSEAYGYTVPMTQASDHVVGEHGVKWPRRLLMALKKRLFGRRPAAPL